MLRIVARVLGVVVAVLAIAGLFVEGQHLANLMNVDIALDIIRIVIAAALLYVGFAPKVSASTVRVVVVIVGAMYVVMGLLAFADRTLFGMLPTGFTGFDIGFHLVVGLGALVLAFLPATARETTSSNSRASAAH